jgi:hypothetical protein
MHPCIICLAGGGDPWNGGICDTCLPSLRPYRSRRRVRFEISVYSIMGDAWLALLNGDEDWVDSP